MPDGIYQTNAAHKLISLDEAYEVRDWAKIFGCTEEQLQEAVKAVGRSVAAVRDFLGRY